MKVLTNTTSVVLWQEVIKGAEDRCSVVLKDELEAYLVSLMIRFTNKPEVVKQIMATAFLNALHNGQKERYISLQNVGDQCLIFAGLFPKAAEKKLVKINYFVDVGRSAYSRISFATNDLFGSLALQFVVLMDVLQSIRSSHDLSPFEAYEQWSLVGSQRALKMVQDYGSLGILPIKKLS